jgi:hypothetical protein
MSSLPALVFEGTARVDLGRSTSGIWSPKYAPVLLARFDKRR